MNMLTNPSDDVVVLVTNLYNNSCTNVPAQNAPSNPFGMGSKTMNNQGGNIFGGVSSSGPTSNLFGSSTPASNPNPNPFASNATANTFGGAQTQASNLFGGSTTAPLFGGARNNTVTGSSLFGGSSFSNTNNPSAFGSTNQTPSAFGGGSQTQSIFGGGATSGPFSQQNANASPFALSTPQTNQPTGLFGGQAQSNPVFGSGASFGSQVKPSVFGQANASLGQSTNTGNIFGQNVQAPSFGAQPQTNPYVNAAPNQTQSIFGGSGGQQQTMQTPDNPFAAVAQSTTTNIFGGQSQMQQQQQQQPSPFQNSNAFGGANANAFGQSANMGQSLFGVAGQAINNQINPVPTQPLTQNLPQQQQSIFGASTFSVPPAQSTQQPTPFGGNIFQSAHEQNSSTQTLFGGQQQQQLQHQQQQPNMFGAPAPQPAQISTAHYTPMDALSQEEIDAFNSNSFDISKIPTKPPPMEFCI